MCDECDRNPAVEPVAEEDIPMMVHESTIVAMAAVSHQANQWFHSARGLIRDMKETWGMGALCRMVYVWASACYFLPQHPGTPGGWTWTEFAERYQQLTDEEPDEAMIGAMVVAYDQASAAVKTLTEAASKGDVKAVADELAGLAGNPPILAAVQQLLLTGAATRLRHSRDVEDTRAMELFNAHIHADMPKDMEEEEGDGD